MRLLRSDGGHAFYFTEDFVRDDEIPPYAILSHTWQEGEEVAYSELTEGSSTEKAGYDKIRFCAQQAKRDGLDYFWVDTCCINKADQVELRDAISSMFRWYQNAARCYVFLSDVSIGKRKSDSEHLEYPWMVAFRASRWFTRGWTLQELLAPKSVEFFSKEWRRLGDKTSLQQCVCEATRIPIKALKGAPLSQFSVNERLKWNEHRKTKLPEDRAYSLMGILGVYISPFDGEGASGAFTRLIKEAEKLNMCLRDLHVTDPRDDKKRIEDTKGGLLKDSHCWVFNTSNFKQWRNSPQSRLLWIKGDPGKGKTMLLCGIINELERSTARLPCFFFCQGTDSRINSGTAVLRGLIYLLVIQQPSLMSYMQERHDQAGSSIFEDANAWVALSDIFMNMIEDRDLKMTYFVVDALDECMTNLPKLLDLIVSTSTSSVRVKWLVSSRNEVQIEQKFRSVDIEAKLSLEQNMEQVGRAVDAYIDCKLSRLESLDDSRLRSQVRDELRHKADGTFLWVALMVQELEKPEAWNPLQVVEETPPGLHFLYDRMIDRVQQLTEKNSEVCRLLLCTATIAYRPLCLAEIGSLCGPLGQTLTLAKNIKTVVAMCGSFLTVRDDRVYIVHQSAKEYLSGEMRGTIFPLQSEVHYSLFSRSLELMSRTLKRDMYDLFEPGFPIDKVQVPPHDPLSTVRYSCVYWVDHLHDSVLGRSTRCNESLQNDNVVHVFLKERYLYWLEALSLCRSLLVGVVSMNKLEALVQAAALENDPNTVITKATTLIQLVSDACRFIKYFVVGIEKSPLQAYACALTFSPTGSLIWRCFQHEKPEWITVRPKIEANWSVCLQTLEGHRWNVNSVAFSHESTLLASASHDNTIKIWNVSSGDCKWTFKGHGSWVMSVAFTHDSMQLASASDDNTIKIWNVSSGDCKWTLKGHGSRVKSVAFTHDSMQLASASRDMTVKIWNVSSGECEWTLEGHSNEVTSVAFSHDSTKLASASEDMTVKIWNVSSGECEWTLDDHSDGVTSVAFSHDSTQLASASLDRTVKIWNVSSGECEWTLEGHSGLVFGITFSHDSMLLASASGDNTAKIWNVSSSEYEWTLEDHSDAVTSVAFSHDSTKLASASVDKTVKIWNVSGNKYERTLESHSGCICNVAFSHNSTLMASASVDDTAKIWNVNSGKCEQTLKGHSDPVFSVAFSHDSTWLASASEKGIVKIWNVSSGECEWMLEGHSGLIFFITFSHDSMLLASVSEDKTAKIWNVSSGECEWTLEGHSDEVTSVAFSHDSTQLASASRDMTVKIWNLNSGECEWTLEDHCDEVTSIAFSHDSTQLASASLDRTVKIWNVSNGNCEWTFCVCEIYRTISFDTTGSRLHTDYGILNLVRAPSSQLVSVVGPNDFQYRGFSLSPDREWIMCHGKNILWLPPGYRSGVFAVSGNNVGIGVGTGKVCILSFTNEYLGVRERFNKY
jgi:WD40 repeat protein